MGRTPKGTARLEYPVVRGLYLLFVDWSVVRSLHQINRVLAVLFVVVGLAMRHDLMVVGFEAPTPKTLRIFVDFVVTC